MLRFVLQKLRNKKWLVASLLIGNILLVAIAAASPMYTKAALQRMLTRTMSDYAQEHSRYPTTAYIYSSSMSGHKNLESDAALVAGLNQRLGVKPMLLLQNRFISNVELYPELTRVNGGGVTARVGTLADMEQHIQIVSGSLYGETTDGVVDAIVSEKALVELGMMQGEIFTTDTIQNAAGEPLRIRIAGVFRASEADIEQGSQFWYRTPSSYSDQLFVSEQAFTSDIAAKNLQDEERRVWYYIFDYNDLTVDNCGVVAAAAQALTAEFKENYYHSFSDYFSGLVDGYQVEAARVAATLRILQVPIYVLLFSFIFMVSRQMLEIESGEISVIKSRGASRRQIIGIYALQGGLLELASLLLGIPLAMLICQIIGSANAFLEFVSRSSLRLELTGTVMLYALAAAAVSMAAMVIPVFGYSSTTVVSRKQSKSRRDKPLWQRLYLDVILMAVSLYGLYTFRGQEAQITAKVQAGAGLDPLIYLASSLFIVACGLLALRIIPLIVRLIYTIGRRWWSPSLYASYLWVLRSRGGYIMVFLVVTIALGIFNASTARTVNNNEIDRICYVDGGADVVLMEQWTDNSDAVADDDTGRTKLAYNEPDFNKYAALPGVESATRVICDTGASASLEGARRSNSVTLMGIHTREFGQTAALKDGLLPEHFYSYLNAISQKSNAVLVSENFREKYGYQLGDSLSYRDSNGNSARGVIYGFVDYWPTYSATTTVRESDGTERETDNLLIVANLPYLQAQWGVTPYQVWLRMKDGDTAPAYELIERQKISLTEFHDQTADLISMKNDPAIQGTNGILTVGFVVALVLCAVGFLIYWILAIQNRALQFGIFRAMGMSMGEIILMLFNEQLYVSGMSIAVGVGAGLLGSRLYVPLVQLAYVKAATPLPLEVSLGGSDVIRLLIAVLVVVALCMCILGTIIRKLKIAQALKLGED